MAKMYQIPADLRPRITLLDGWELFASSVGMYGAGLRASVGLHNGALQLSETLHLSLHQELHVLAEKIAETIGAGQVSAADIEKRLLELCDTLDSVLLKLEEEAKKTSAKADVDEESLFLQDPEPWDEPVDGANLIETLRAAIERFVVLPLGAAYSIALWILHSYALDAAFASPILYLWSPRKRCGKSTLLSILAELCSRALPASNISAASFYRAVNEWQPTLIIDEADTFLRNNEELAGIINAGHTRKLAYVLRTNPDTYKPERFSTWAPKAIAGIGRQRETLEDRSIQIPMRRKTKEEKVERLRVDQTNQFDELKRMSVRWVSENIDAIRDADPDLPDYLDDRAADNWRTLCAIAEVAGEGCLKKAHEAIHKLYGEFGQSTDDDSPEAMLLQDLKEALESRPHGRITSENLIALLHDKEDRPWPEWGRLQKPITKLQVAGLLRPYGIRPKEVRDKNDKGKGYKIEDCQDAFYRYLPPENLENSATTPSQDATPRQPSNDEEISDFQAATKNRDVADEKTRKSAPLQDCRGVAFQKGGLGQKQTVEPKRDVSDAPLEDDFDEEF